MLILSFSYPRAMEGEGQNQTPTETEDTHVQLRCSTHCLRRRQTTALDGRQTAAAAAAASEPTIQNLAVAILREVVAHGRRRGRRRGSRRRPCSRSRRRRG